MKALLFPGQGSQVVGMGSEFYKEFDLVKKIFLQADERLQIPLTKIILEGPSDKLQMTANTQPAILTVSFSIFKVLKDEFNLDLTSFKFFAGHSLGEYSALVSSGALDFNDAIYLLNERGKAMQEAVPLGKGSMAAVLGLSITELKNLLNEHNNGICEIANDNSKGQVIVSGEKDSVHNFLNKLKERKIKSIPLNVSAPFHCSLMKPASKIMEEKINNTKFYTPNYKIINNVTAEEVSDTSKIKKLLVEQIYSPVKWRESIIRMFDLGVKDFIELGPGKALTGMVKRTIQDTQVNCFSINSITDIKNLNDQLKK